MRHLCARISRPSTVGASLDSWIASLVATRASRSASPVDSAAPLIPGISGPISEGSDRRTVETSCATSGSLPFSSSKTSPTICGSDSLTSPATYARWVTQLRRACLQRRKSAQLRSVSACSSWPTPRTLTGDAESATRKKELGRTESGGGDLQAAAQAWSTPRASDGEKGGPQQQFGAGGTPLPAQAVKWATPTTRDHKDGSSPSANVPTNCLLGRQAPRMMSSGRASFASAPTSRLQLNPSFVEWLMGWPLGWTVCGSSATVSSLRKPPTPSDASPQTLRAA